MNPVNQILAALKNKWELFLGWFEIALKSDRDRRYKYVMEDIEIEEYKGKLFSMINYKLVGCRKLNSEPATELNKLALFALFGHDDAQMIVSIATVEALMGHTQDEILEKYKRYVSSCNLKLNGRK